MGRERIKKMETESLIITMTEEIWKDIPGYEGLYQVSNFGRVKSLRKAIIMSIRINKKGYSTIGLSKTGVFNRKSIHRLVAEAFIPNPDNLPCVNHKDGNKLNNELNNLEWCTYGDNERHAYRTGLKHCGDRKGDKAFNRKLTSDQVAYIKKVYKKGDSTYGGRALAKIFNVSESCISSIMLCHSWGGV